MTRVGLLALTIAVVAAIGAVVFALATVADPGGCAGGPGYPAGAAGRDRVAVRPRRRSRLVRPLPALALAVVWAFTVSGQSPAAGWWLVALSAAACGGGVIVAGTALRQRLRGRWSAPRRLAGGRPAWP